MKTLYRRRGNWRRICFLVLMAFMLQITLTAGLPSAAYANEGLEGNESSIGATGSDPIAMPVTGDAAAGADAVNVETGLPNEDIGDTETDETGQGTEAKDDPGHEEESNATKDDAAASAPEGAETVADAKAEPEPEPKGKRIGEGSRMQPLGENESPKQLAKIFTFKSLKIGDEEIESNEPIEITESTVVQITYAWDTKDKGAKAGDWATLQIPKILKPVKAIDDEKITVTPEDGDEVVVGTYTLTLDGRLTFTFNEEIEGGEVQAGVWGFGLNFDLEKFETNVVQEIAFDQEEEKTFTLIAQPAETKTALSKLGDPDASQDPTFITWTIDLANRGNTEITEAKLTDQIPTGLSLIEGSVEVYNLTVGLNGALHRGEEVDNGYPGPTENGEGAANTLGLTFAKLPPYKGYCVVYKTAIKEFASSFKNAATLEYQVSESETKILTAKTTVSDLAQSDWLEKSGVYEEATGQIKWTLEVNKCSGQVSGAKIKETLPAGLSLVEDSLQIQRLQKSGDNWNPMDNGEVPEISGPTNGDNGDGGNGGFLLNLGDLETTDAYRITFNTAIDYTKVNEGVYQKTENEFENTATLQNGAANELQTVTAKVTFERAPLIEKTEISGITYTEKALKWELEINRAKHPLKEVQVIDTLPAGLKITAGNISLFKVVDGEEESLTFNENGENEENPTLKIESLEENGENGENGKTKITMTLGDIGTDHYRIRYETEVTDFGPPNFKNEVEISGGGIGDKNAWTGTSLTISTPDNAYLKPDPERSDVNYAEKTIKWSITVDPSKEPIKALTLTDTFPHKGLILLPDTRAVKLGNNTLIRASAEAGEGEDGENGAGGETSTADYTLAPYGENGETGDKGYHQGFVLTFTNKYNERNPLDGAKITITYQTSYDPEKEVDGKFLEANESEDGTYKNQAEFTVKTLTREIDKTVSAEYKVREDSWNTGKKEGRLVWIESDNTQVDGWKSGAERKIAWQVYINYLQQNLGAGVTVKDTLQYDGAIDEANIQVAKYTVNPDGTTNITGDILAPSKYSVNFSQDEKTFTLTFNEAITERYVIQFLTSVPDISADTYTNKVVAKVKDGEEATECNYEASVGYEKYDWFLKKEALKLIGSQVFTGDLLDWEVTVNESLSKIKKAEIEDTISTGLAYVKDSLKVYQLGGDEKVALDCGAYTSTLPDPGESGETTLTIQFSEHSPIDCTIIVNYQTVVTATDAKVNNKVTFSGDEIEKISEETKELTASQFSFVSGELVANKGAIKLIKKDAETRETISDNTTEAKFSLWYDLNGIPTQFGGQGATFTMKKGELTLGNLSLRKYFLKEEKAPAGYALPESPDGLDGYVAEIDVDKKWNNNDENIIQVEIENTKLKTDITAEKVWVDSPDEKPTIWFQLLRQIGGESPEVVPGAAILELAPGLETVTWKAVDKTNMQGEAYTYTVKEVNVEGEDFCPEFYQKEEEGLTVTNTYTYTSDKIEVTGTKEWKGGPSVKPEIELQLYQNNEAYGAPVLLKDGETTHTWTVDKTDHGRVLYQYRVDEVKQPASYSKSLSEDGLTVTNTYVSPYVPAKTAITGGKVWVGGPEIKPTIELQLYRNGEAFGEAVSLAHGQQSYTWNDVELTDSAGKPYVYTVDETSPPVGYEKFLSADGLTVTNLYKGIKEYALDLVANPTTIVGDGKSNSVLTGQVTDENGDPVEGVEVVFDAPAGTFHGDPNQPEDGKKSGVTDKDGKARILYRSEKIEGIETKVIPVTASVEDREKDLYATDTIYVTFEPASITGVVTDNTTGQPIEGARVIVTKDFGDKQFRGEYLTGIDGAYKIAIPKGDTVYDVEIIKPVYVNQEEIEVSFKQKARVGNVDESSKDEEFPAVETFSGLIITKDKQGRDRIACKETADRIFIKPVTAGNVTDEGTEVDTSTGVFTIENLEKGRSYEFVMIAEKDGQELVMGRIQVQLDTDGQISIHEELIDPYGTITDGKTGKVLGGVEVELFYADTDRNRAKNRTPHTRVDLPLLPGFAPNDNENPQNSTPNLIFNNEPGVQDHGNYAWMVFPQGDYYIVGTKGSYKTYTSETISVDYDIVKHDFKMWPIESSGGGTDPVPEPDTGERIVPDTWVWPEGPVKPDEQAAPKAPEAPVDRVEPMEPETPPEEQKVVESNEPDEAPSIVPGNAKDDATPKKEARLGDMEKDSESFDTRSMPKTGDTTPILWLALLTVTSLGAALYLIKRKKRGYS